MRFQNLQRAVVSLLALALGSTGAHAQNLKDFPTVPVDPKFQQGEPIFSAADPIGATTVYNSYWVHGTTRISCQTEQFCYIYMPPTTYLRYNGAQWEKPFNYGQGIAKEWSLATGIKSQNVRLKLMFPHFTFADKKYDDKYDFAANGYPDVKVHFYLDDEHFLTHDYGPKNPLNVTIYSDYTPNGAPTVAALVNKLFHADPETAKTLRVRLISMARQPSRWKSMCGISRGL
ncbi:MAG: hypothetical protein R3D99_03015 [Altererythrobacter sp.]